MHYLANKFEKEGHKILVTTRPYSIDRSNSNLDRLSRKYTSLGKYGGASLEGKLIASSKRILELAPLITKFDPDLLISFPSPDAFRTAFGLGIKSIQINDSPHSYAPGRLTISLSNALVHSDSIDSKEFSNLGVTQFYPYRGVDEILWIKEYKPDFNTMKDLGIEKDNYVVLRCEESKAGYFQRMYPDVTPGNTIVTQLVDKLVGINPNLKIVAFPRYPEQEKQLMRNDVIIPEMSVDTLSLFYYSKAVMTAGGTMGREAALLGTPTLYTFPHELIVSKYVTTLGFPLLHCPDHNKIFEEMIKLINSPKMDEQQRVALTNKLETPYDGVARAMADLELIS
jgi:predicted glycosyltransferase